MVRTDFQEHYQSVDEVLKDLGQSRNDSHPQDHPLNDESETLATNLVNQTESTKKQTTLGNRYRHKLLYLPLILILLVLVTSELIRP